MRDSGVLKRSSQLTQEPEVQLLPPKLFLGSLLGKDMETKEPGHSHQWCPSAKFPPCRWHHFASGSVGVSVATVTSDPGSGLPLQLHCHSAGHSCPTSVCITHAWQAVAVLPDSSWGFRSSVDVWVNLILRPESLIPGGGLWPQGHMELSIGTPLLLYPLELSKGLCSFSVGPRCAPKDEPETSSWAVLSRIPVLSNIRTCAPRSRSSCLVLSFRRILSRQFQSQGMLTQMGVFKAVPLILHVHLKEALMLT